MGPDEPVNAQLGEFAAMTVTILDKEATGSLVLPAPPTVISLADFGNQATQGFFSNIIKTEVSYRNN